MIYKHYIYRKQKNEQHEPQEKRQTMIYKHYIYRKQKIEQHEPQEKPGMYSGDQKG
jgi:hypothetical protein